MADDPKIPQQPIMTGPSPGQIIIVEDLTDLGNAYRFQNLFKGQVHFCPDTGEGLIWDGQRHRNSRSLIVQAGIKTVESIFNEIAPGAVYQTSHGETVDADDLIAHANYSSRKGSIDNLLKVAENLPGLSENRSEFDKEKHFLNCQNGIINLKTGELFDHDPQYKLTQIAGTEYDPRAKCENWEKFIKEITKGDSDLGKYLQILAGLFLTGETRDQSFYILHGIGSNGKSTWVELLLKAIGSYGKTTPSSTLLSGNNDRIRNDLARLPGVRFVSAVELSQGRKLDEALVKQITGGDVVTARLLFHEYFEFSPQFKIILVVNHLPEIIGRDDGIWRRIKVVPFRAQFKGKTMKKDLREKLMQELPGILAWAVEGTKLYYQKGIEDPPEVIKATEIYRNSFDHVSNFIAECCTNVNRGGATIGAIYEYYKVWADENDIDPLKKQEFNEALRSKDYTDKKSNGQRIWDGLSVKIKTAMKPQQEQVPPVQTFPNPGIATVPGGQLH